MADQTRKDQNKDLPPKKVAKRDEESVKGGATISTRPRPAEPIND